MTPISIPRLLGVGLRGAPATASLAALRAGWASA